MIADVLVLCVSYIIAARLEHRYETLSGILVSHSHLLVYSLFVYIASFTAVGLYRTISNSSFQRHMFNAGKGYFIGSAIILSSLFLAQSLSYSRYFILLLFTILPLLYFTGWVVLRNLVNIAQEKGYGRWDTLAIGAEPALNRLIHKVEEYPELGYDIVSVLKVPHEPGDDGAMHVRADQVESLVREKRIRLIVFSSPNLNGSFDQLEELCKLRRIGMRLVSPESDYLFSRARLHDIAGIPLFTPMRRRTDSVKRWIKRIFDVVGAVFGLIFTSPIFLIVAIATKLESRGPVFFKQKRSLTDQDRPFEFYKFRSMHDSADEMRETLLQHNESTGALFKLKNDPRLTRIGKFIRKFSIDELPQLFNVLKGEMSLVGPRPLPVGDFALLEDGEHMGGYYRQRAKAKPGITGLWQVSGRSDLGFRDMVLLDLYYIEKQSLLFDIEILAQTFPVVIFGKGAY